MARTRRPRDCRCADRACSDLSASVTNNVTTAAVPNDDPCAMGSKTRWTCPFSAHHVYRSKHRQPCGQGLFGDVGRNQARVDCKTFAADQAGRDARLDDPLEYATENIPLAEALVART
jgi:hypothetical protein